MKGHEIGAYPAALARRRYHRMLRHCCSHYSFYCRAHLDTPTNLHTVPNLHIASNGDRHSEACSNQDAKAYQDPNKHTDAYTRPAANRRASSCWLGEIRVLHW